MRRLSLCSFALTGLLWALAPTGCAQDLEIESKCFSCRVHSDCFSAFCNLRRGVCVQPGGKVPAACDGVDAGPGEIDAGPEADAGS